MTDEIAISKHVVFDLMVGCLDALVIKNEGEGCCPFCCFSCHTLVSLLDRRWLDKIPPELAEGSPWWNSDKGRIDRQWLDSAWRRVACHEDRKGFEGSRVRVNVNRIHADRARIKVKK